MLLLSNVMSDFQAADLELEEVNVVVNEVRYIAQKTVGKFVDTRSPLLFLSQQGRQMASSRQDGDMWDFVQELCEACYHGVIFLGLKNEFLIRVTGWLLSDIFQKET